MSNVPTRRTVVTTMVAGTTAAFLGGATLATELTSHNDTPPQEWLDLIAAYRRAQAKAATTGEAFAAAERAFAEQRKPEPAKAVRVSPVDRHMTIAQIAALPAEAFVHTDPAWEAWKAENDADRVRVVEPKHDAWAAALSDADAAMMAVQDYPSTSLAMMAVKLRLLADHYRDDIPDAREMVGVIADARRLSKEA